MYHVQITKTLPVGHRKIMSEDLVSGQVPELDRAEAVSTMACLQKGQRLLQFQKLLAYSIRIKTGTIEITDGH